MKRCPSPDDAPVSLPRRSRLAVTAAMLAATFGYAVARGGDGVTTKLQFGGAVESLAWSSDGETLAVQTKPGKDKRDQLGEVSLWNPRTGQMKRLLAEVGQPTFSIALSPDGKRVACARWVDRAETLTASEIWTWDMTNGDRGQTFSTARQRGLGVPFTADLLAIAYSPDGKLLAGGGKLTGAGGAGAVYGSHIGGDVSVWDENGRLIWNNRTVHADIVYAVAFSPDGQTLASAGIDKLIRLWNPHTGDPKGALHGVAWDGVISLTFSPDGRFIAAGGQGREEGGRVRIWDSESRELIRTVGCFEGEHGVRIAFAPDGKTLFAVATTALGDDPKWQARGVDLATGKRRDLLPEQRGFSKAISVSPDGQFLAIGTWQGDVLVFSPAAR